VHVQTLSGRSKGPRVKKAGPSYVAGRVRILAARSGRVAPRAPRRAS